MDNSVPSRRVRFTPILPTRYNPSGVHIQDARFKSNLAAKEAMEHSIILARLDANVQEIKSAYKRDRALIELAHFDLFHMARFLTAEHLFQVHTPRAIQTLLDSPVFILVPGAFHPGSLYQPLLDELTKQGYETHAITNRSVAGDDPENITTQDDANYARGVITSYLDRGEDVVVICHSYGGLVGSTASYGLTKADRQAAGAPGGVAGLIGIACLLVPEGVSLSEASGGQMADWIDVNEPREGLCVANSHDALYGPEMAAKPAEGMLRKTAPQGTKVFASPPGKPAWSDPNMKGRLGYIKCLHDKAVSVEGQAGMLQMTGQEWHVVHSDTGHSPFASKPVETARYCLYLLEKFRLAAWLCTMALLLGSKCVRLWVTSLQ
ncbi:cysteine-tRNA ligase [Elsinoe australis]|uniref:Cysteine-tRNA ligase n=1 Tax=Elsinoe australis TaxID=40998 RepID=A0A2P7ZDF6_9PEZI|nr:cysteine-tRNA ligase [Elsinoe australis]